jgi:hypothetical protein
MSRAQSRLKAGCGQDSLAGLPALHADLNNYHAQSSNHRLYRTGRILPG